MQPGHGSHGFPLVAAVDRLCRPSGRGKPGTFAPSGRQGTGDGHRGVGGRWRGCEREARWLRYVEVNIAEDYS